MSRLNNIMLFLAAFVAIFLEASFGGFRYWLGAQIDLLPALVVYASLSSSFLVLTLLAVLGGLFFDSLSANPLGVSMLPLLLIGLLIHVRRGLILRETTYAQFVLGLVASAIAPALSLLLMLSMRHTPLLGWGTVWQWLVMSVGGGLFTPVCFKLFDGFDRALNYRPVVETSFRPDREIRRSRSY